MKNPDQFKIEIKQALPKEGLTYVLKALKEALPHTSPKYNLLIQLESEYREVKLKIIEGILSSEETQRTNNRLRKRLLQLIDSLSADDFSGKAASSRFEPDQTIRRGYVLYQVPKTMQLKEESRCRVRIAFDKLLLIEDLDLDENTEIRSNVRISDYMKVEIIDPNRSSVFAIRSNSEPIQFIDKDDFTEWRFYVQPLMPGKHLLELKITIMLMIDGELRVRERILEENIEIVTEPAPAMAEEAFQQLDETFDLGGTPLPSILDKKESGGARGLEESAGDTPPPPPKIEKQVLPTETPSIRPAAPKKDSRVRLPKAVRTIAYSFLAIIIASTGAYAAVPQEIDWWRARYLADSEEIYEWYMDKHPESRHTETATFRWAAVQKDPIAYKTYLERYPNGRFAEKSTWWVASLSDDPEAYLSYVDNYPRGEKRVEAVQALKRLEPKVWKAAENQGDEVALKNYLKLYPNGQHRTDAERRLDYFKQRSISVPTAPISVTREEQRLWDAVQDSPNLPALNKFLENHPKSVYAKEARELLRKLKAGDIQKKLEKEKY